MIRGIKRKFKKLWKRGRKPVFIVVGVIALALSALYTVYLSHMNATIDPKAYRPLLDLIARAESNGNYNAYFGNPGNTEADFTSMTIDEVLRWQKEYVKKGSPSSAVGRYQMLDTTLAGLVNRLGVNTTEKFDEVMQDRLAVALLEKRGAREFMRGQLSREEFAANLAKEWAGLPKVLGDNPQDSYYAGDGLNKSRVEVGEVLGVLERIDTSS